MAVTAKEQALAAAKELEAEFLAALKGQIPAADEAAVIAWAAQTLAAAPLLAGIQPDVAEQAAKAKAALKNLAIAHQIDGEVAAAAIVQSAIAKGQEIVLRILGDLLKAAIVV